MLKFIFSLITGSGAFILVNLFAGFWISSLSALAAFVISWRIFKAIQLKLKDRAENIKKPGTTKTTGKKGPNSAEAAKVADAGIKRLQGIRNQTQKIQKHDVALKIQDICKVGVEIFNDIRDNPDDLKKAKQFINYYMETTEKIVTQYVELSNKKDITPEIKKTLGKVEDLLDTVKKTFDKQMANLLEDDLLDLDVEIKVLKSTMEMDG
ncbi:MAG: hypothetical protein GY754_41265 [bacterium]|nr:hypothetical protein [bacterium]